MFGAAAARVVACLRGRSGTTGRGAVIVIYVAGRVLTAVATSTTVDEVGNATLPMVTALIGLLAFLDRPVIALADRSRFARRSDSDELEDLEGRPVARAALRVDSV